ncbi:proteasome subunit beta 2 [Ectocarpus siliculosus]|uniref:proteasome endopeptidase complex n=1 Tax=Ectocarpus siliculosus TaxID=2880 RepID=D7FTB7_ECTSI|nr:proteasome subunit beta 2 [Ectocarpus siliculosus]|eukprot:CBJ31383.1 proteasome subunit beta 2 [Ectocarpus siliculosus]
MKTGTTIAGVVFEGGVVLGADTRATGGKTVCDRNCDKIHILASNIACCGAGTSADAVRITEGARLALLRMAREMQACLPSSRSPLLQCQSRADEERALASCDSGLDEVQRKHLRVGAAALLLKRHLFRYQGTVSAALVLGGVDVIGEHIYQIHEGGSLAEVEFTAMGSGSLAALSVLERGYRENLTEQEAKELVLEGIAAGIDNDLGSGSNIDLCVITAERGLEHHRGAWTDPGLDDDDIAARELPEGSRGSENDNKMGQVQHTDARPIPRGDREGVAKRAQSPHPAAPATASVSRSRVPSIARALHRSLVLLRSSDALVLCK